MLNWPRPSMLEEDVIQSLAPPETGGDRIIKIQGVTFRCECGCNVFRPVSETKYKCNGCSATYTGEK